jgi:diguanylate cyclase (GGDEF)-like protein
MMNSKQMTTKLLSEIKNNFSAMAIASAVFIVFFVMFEVLISAESAKADAKLRVAASHYVATLKSKVDRELNTLLFVSNGLSSYLTIYYHELDHQRVQNVLADLYTRTNNVRNLAIAVGYTITYMYPIQSNEKAIGVDYRNLPQQWPKVKEAIDRHQGVLTGPLDLVQGGRGLIYRYPVYIDQKYWGLLSTVINSDAFFDSAFRPLLNDEFDFAIRDQHGKAVYGDSDLFHRQGAIISTSDFPDAAWEWVVLQKTEKAPQLIVIARLMGIVIAVLLSALVYFLLRERKMLTALAMHDSLTGLANRRLLDFRLEQALAHAKRFKRNLAILFVDIDHFKKLNDTYGHDVGDALLKVIATRLKSAIRDVDTVSRISGDEFVIVLDELNDINDANVVAGKIVHLFKEHAEVLGERVPMSVSIGVASFGQDGEETTKRLLKKADIALYEAKGAGRNQFRVFTEVEQKSLFDS